MPKFDLTLGVQDTAIRLFAYGPEGIGKSTLAAQLPGPIFIDIENGTKQLPVARMPRPTSWTMLKNEITAIRDGAIPSCQSLVIDTADAAEKLCISSVCAENDVTGIEKMSYGRGYVFAFENWCKMLDLLGEVVDRGINVILLGHSRLEKFERPDESGAYDRYSPKLIDSKRASISAATKEWADMVLFLDYKIYVTDEGGKAKASGGRRIIHTTHHPCWDAKNRFGLPDEMPLNDETVARINEIMYEKPIVQESEPEPAPKPTPSSSVRHSTPPITTPQHASRSSSGNKKMEEVEERIARMDAKLEQERSKQKPEPKPSTDVRDTYPARMKSLADLMKANGIEDDDLRRAMAEKGYVTYETPVEKYQQRLVDGVVASWDRFVKFVQQIKDGPTPF